ncbi:glycosyltransferase [Novosphingobium sp. KACC 22771]|uniref:glycosyltransferase n=1 Tax=Novosphingobium sp. KACC 22771 TaxID=3025670 RepID=UPI002365E170|nr:glycosyltransferase [Novosphingobium sp. KACC 22771]WDF72873.1 glycosyltransferase [Novosphingobium sp. KACC 22771]
MSDGRKTEAPLAGRRIGLMIVSASRNAGGVFEAVVAHAEMIRALGAEAVVFAIEDEHTRQDCARFGPTRVVTCPGKGPRQIGYAPDLVQALMVENLDCLHLHGIWMYPSRAGAVWAAVTQRPYFVSPHGMLDPWIFQRSPWKKRLARWAWEKDSWQRASAIHALTAREARDIASRTGRSDSLIIPNPGPDPVFATSSSPRAPVMLYIGRIHTKKNLLPLVQAWHGMDHPDGAVLKIAGWGDGQDVVALEAAIAAGPGRIEFLGPVFGEAKQALLEEARFMVLPSLSEGLPMAILEAWAAGMPTIMTRECNLDMGFSTGAAVECGFDASSISASLAQAWAMGHDEWQTRTGAARQLAGSMFSAEAVTAQWGHAYGAAMAKMEGRR